jgi:hypothetical protein
MYLVADLTADGSDARHIFLDLAIQFDLQIAIALIAQLLSLGGHLFWSLDGKDAQDRHAATYLSAQQLAQRNAQCARLQVIKGAIDPGLGLRGAADGAIKLA